MIITKILETRIDLFNVKYIFCSNYNDIIIEELKKRFVKRCYKSIFITDILEIVKRSSIKCKNKVLDGSVYVDVQFKAEGIIYENGDIIHNCKIIQINDNNTMLAKSDQISLQINNSTNFNIFKVGEEIPVIVRIVRYNIMQDGITVVSIPFVPIAKNIIFYRLTDMEPDENFKLLLKSEMVEIDNLSNNLDILKKKNKNIYAFFRDLIYPFKKYDDIKKIKQIETLKINEENLLSLVNNDSLVVFRPNLYLDDDSMFIASEDVIDNNLTHLNGLIVDSDYQTIMLDLLMDYKKNLLKFIEFITVYDSLEKIKKSPHVWQLYSRLKL